jgi:hypothetical protein
VGVWRGIMLVVVGFRRRVRLGLQLKLAHVSPPRVMNRDSQRVPLCDGACVGELVQLSASGLQQACVAPDIGPVHSEFKKLGISALDQRQNASLVGLKRMGMT